jgi:hypothetical protein
MEDQVAAYWRATAGMLLREGLALVCISQLSVWAELKFQELVPKLSLVTHAAGRMPR